MPAYGQRKSGIENLGRSQEQLGLVHDIITWSENGWSKTTDARGMAQPLPSLKSSDAHHIHQNEVL